MNVQEEIDKHRAMQVVVQGWAQNGRLSRNKPCPCGSGKKFKRCCARYLRSRIVIQGAGGTG